MVSEAARRCGVTARAIRFYEECGLVGSHRGRSGQRLYDEAAIERLSFICEMRRLGLTVSEARYLLHLGDTRGAEAQSAHVLAACRRRLAELEADMSAVRQTIAAREVTPAKLAG